MLYINQHHVKVHRVQMLVILLVKPPVTHRQHHQEVLMDVLIVQHIAIMAVHHVLEIAQENVVETVALQVVKMAVIALVLKHAK